MTISLGHGDLADLPRPRRGCCPLAAGCRRHAASPASLGSPAALRTRPMRCSPAKGFSWHKVLPERRFQPKPRASAVAGCPGARPPQRVPALRMGLPAFRARFVFAFPHGRLAPVVQTITCPRAQRYTVVSTVTRASRRMPKAALAACTRSSGIGCAASSVPIRLQNAAGVSARAGATRPTASVTTAAVTTHTTLCLDRASNVDDSPPSHLVGPSIAVRRSSGHRTGHRLAVRR
jgi:hypothetical protein